MTIKLVKYKKGRDGVPTLISNECSIEARENDLMLKFAGKDKRCPSYAVLIDNDEARKIVDKMLVYLSKH